VCRNRGTAHETLALKDDGCISVKRRTGGLVKPSVNRPITIKVSKGGCERINPQQENGRKRRRMMVGLPRRSTQERERRHSLSLLTPTDQYDSLRIKDQYTSTTPSEYLSGTQLDTTSRLVGQTDQIHHSGGMCVKRTLRIDGIIISSSRFRRLSFTRSTRNWS
jgi:hypothetical protein